MQWLNEPARWSSEGGTLTVTADPGTDFWRTTGYGYIRDNGHLYGDLMAGDFDLALRVRGSYAAQYDQAGIMVRVDAQNWLKTGVEFFDGAPRFSTVITRDFSSWAVGDLPAGHGDLALAVTRRGDAVEVRFAVGDAEPRVAALAYLPPAREALAGAMCAAPEGPGFGVAFSDLRLSSVSPSAVS